MTHFTCQVLGCVLPEIKWWKCHSFQLFWVPTMGMKSCSYSGEDPDWTCGFYPFTLKYNKNNHATVEWEPDLVSKVLGSNPTSSAWRLCSTEQGRFSTSDSSSISKEVIISAGSEVGWEINTGKLSMCLQHNRCWGKVSFLPSLRRLEADR